MLPGDCFARLRAALHRSLWFQAHAVVSSRGLPVRPARRCCCCFLLQCLSAVTMFSSTLGRAFARAFASPAGGYCRCCCCRCCCCRRCCAAAVVVVVVVVVVAVGARKSYIAEVSIACLLLLHFGEGASNVVHGRVACWLHVVHAPRA